MSRLMAKFILILFSGLAYSNPGHATECPTFYRFVDFGLSDEKGNVYRGGTILRAEGFNGDPLLLTNQTQCRQVAEVSKDGHGNPIPVVTTIAYKPEITGIGINELRVSIAPKTIDAASENALQHQKRLTKPEIKITKGSNFLCASDVTLSCQIVSPFAGNRPLVVYCDAGLCKMPVLAMNDNLLASASWQSNEQELQNAENLALEILKKVQGIHDFLKPLSATF